MYHAYKLACLNYCCQLLSYFDGELKSGSLMKKCSWCPHQARWGLKSGVLRARNSTILQFLCAGALSCWKMQSASQAIPTNVWKRLFWAISVAAMINLQQFAISEPDKVHHRSKVPSHSANDSTSRDEQACTHYTLWHQYYVTNSKEYLINSHIELKYFE